MQLYFSLWLFVSYFIYLPTQLRRHHDISHVCTNKLTPTPNQLLGSLTGMMGGGMTGDDGNATQQMMMGLMQQQMMSGAGGMENMTEAELQHVMNMVICLPAMNEEMMQSMMGNGQNSTSSMMSGMMMQ